MASDEYVRGLRRAAEIAQVELSLVPRGFGHKEYVCRVIGAIEHAIAEREASTPAGERETGEGGCPFRYGDTGMLCDQSPDECQRRSKYAASLRHGSSSGASWSTCLLHGLALRCIGTHRDGGGCRAAPPPEAGACGRRTT